MSDRVLHSIVVPVYNEIEVIDAFHARVAAAMESVGEGFEVIYVDDGSSDGSWNKLLALQQSDPHVRLLRLARNFGHQTAITAGIDAASGDTVTVLDADLQDPPEVIPRLIEEWRAGADVVFAVRQSREGETAFKRVTASAYYRLLRRLSQVDIPLDAGDFRLMSARAASGLRAMRERSRYIRGLVGWMGLRRAYVTYERDARFAGETKYPLRKMLRLASDGVVSFSSKPLRLALWLGLFATGLAIVVTGYALAVRFSGGQVADGWTSLMVAVLFMAAVQLVMLGVIGEYLGRVYDEVRRRPLYLVGEVAGFEGTVAEEYADAPVPVIVDPGARSASRES